MKRFTAAEKSDDEIATGRHCDDYDDDDDVIVELQSLNSRLTVHATTGSQTHCL